MLRQSEQFLIKLDGELDSEVFWGTGRDIGYKHEYSGNYKDAE
jgi:hypothetical protein